MQVRFLPSRPRRGAIFAFPVVLLCAAPLAIGSQQAFAEASPSPGASPAEAAATPVAAPDADSAPVSPVAPDVQLRDVTSEDVPETSNPAPTDAAQAADSSSETAADKLDDAAESVRRAETGEEPPAAPVQAPSTASQPAAQPEAQQAASASSLEAKTTDAPAAQATVNPKVDAVAEAFAAKLIGETPPEPDTAAADEARQPDEASTPLSAELEEPPRPKAVVGEPPAPIEKPVQEVAADLRLLGSIVKPGTAARLGWSPGVAISGLDQPTPVLVVHGAKPGPTLCLTSAVHGDELNGIEVVRGVMYDLDPKDLSGTVIGVPIVNLQGFHRGSRYLVDRRDLNRFFPGYASGSMASRIAASLFNDIILNCNMLVDIHTGSLRRANLPQLRADMRSEKVVEFTKGFDNMVVVHSPGSPGMMRSAAVDRGIASVTLEIGESLRIQRDEIKAGIHSINSLLEKQDMYQRLLIWGEPRPVFYNSTWLRTDRGGILESRIELGARVEKGDSLGVVIDPITNKGTDIISDIRGRVIGMAVDQVVMPGFATYHIGIESSERALGFQTEIQGRTKDAEPPTVEE